MVFLRLVGLGWKCRRSNHHPIVNAIIAPTASAAMIPPIAVPVVTCLQNDVSISRYGAGMSVTR